MSNHHRRIPSRQWRKLRAQVLLRDGFRCQVCGRAGKMEVDHIVPMEKGGHPTDPDGLQAICVPCHIDKTRGERGAAEIPGHAEWRALVSEIAAEGES